METILILCIVALAIVYVVHRTCKSVKEGSSCRCDCTCSGNEQEYMSSETS